jgi:hypothetical protein
MGALLASRKAELGAVAEVAPDSAPPPAERSRRLIRQIRDFFKLA